MLKMESQRDSVCLLTLTDSPSVQMVKWGVGVLLIGGLQEESGGDSAKGSQRLPDHPL